MVEATDRPEEVRIDEILMIPGESSLDRGLGRAFNKQIQAAGVRKVLAIADVAVAELDSPGSQPPQRQFAAAPLQIVERDYCAVRHVSLERQGEMRTDKTRAAGDHYSHLIRCPVDCSMWVVVTGPALDRTPPCSPPIRGWSFPVARDGDRVILSHHLPIG
jgi:hypothetical protein